MRHVRLGPKFDVGYSLSRLLLFLSPFANRRDIEYLDTALQGVIIIYHNFLFSLIALSSLFLFWTRHLLAALSFHCARLLFRR